MARARISAARAATLLAIALGACAGDDAAGDPTTGADGTTAGSTGGPPSDDSGLADTGPADTGPADTGPADTGGTTGASTATTGNDDSTGTTQGAPEAVELSNDSWTEGGPATYMGGFVQDECWASTFVPQPDDYPFVVDATRLLVGGTDRGVATFSIGLWSVDQNNQPLAELAAANVDLTGISTDIDTVLLGLAGIESPVFQSGNFALVGCLSAHDGFPAIAADNDGQVDFPDRNWIRTQDGTWSQSADLQVTGDWVMRATISPSP